MGKYFDITDIDLIESEDLAKCFRRADKRPENFIRIALNEDGMHLNYRNTADFEIFQALIFIWDIHGNICRYDFHQNDPKHSFYAAADPNNFMAVVLDDPNYPLERLYMFDSSESLMGMLKTENSTVFIIYDGESDHVGYGYYLENEGYPLVYEKLMSLFEISRPRTNEENNPDSE